MPEPRIREGSVREVSWSEFDRQVQALAARIRKEFKPDAVVGVAHGGVFVGGALASALGVVFFPVRISRRSRDRASLGKKPRITGSMPKELQGLRVVLVDDVAASGETLELGKTLLAKLKPKGVATACLVCKDEGYAPDFFALRENRLVVFPWDYDLIDDARFSPGGAK
ncbi:MAG TPA: phosphoribosyltransferase family protein [Myxococcaceae bacterium]|jgi:hypoxanthine phosphoribosyltransferase|nr:phosphoribosyltransferase family protein [Myxococcaceae bacterium]